MIPLAALVGLALAALLFLTLPWQVVLGVFLFSLAVLMIIAITDREKRVGPRKAPAPTATKPPAPIDREAA
ncbi:MAG TPA: hypothetical protein VMS11_07350 [Solirubrobacterales bacterium]|nr:hypothetical protein [Solirubrobacterales bacterium]